MTEKRPRVLKKHLRLFYRYDKYVYQGFGNVTSL